MGLSVTDITLSRKKLPHSCWNVIRVFVRERTHEVELRFLKCVITNLFPRATSSQRVLLSAAGGQSWAHSYLLLCLLSSSLHSKTYCACSKKEKERDVCSFLFVTGFTKLCFNKLLELLSSTVRHLCEFILFFFYILFYNFIHQFCSISHTVLHILYSLTKT